MNSTPERPSPQMPAYLTAVTACGDVEAEAEGEAYLKVVSKKTREASASANPLLTLLESRNVEGARVLTGRGLPSEADARAAARGVLQKQKQKQDASLPPPPPCPELVQRWRDAARVWPCHLYAYAAPTTDAIEALKAASGKWIEIGAGLGYWAAAMKKIGGMDVAAFDLRPTRANSAKTGNNSAKTERQPSPSNEYHGDATPFYDVVAGDASSAACKDAKHRGLFLCYPPPGDRVASDAFRAHAAAGGGLVAVVGEWDGNTGSATFATELSAACALVRRVPLPQWGDTAHELTIWRTKSDVGSGGGDGGDARYPPTDACAGCGGERMRLRRCVHCRVAIYCSSACAKKCAEAHALEHAARHVPGTASDDVDAASDYAAYDPFRRRVTSFER